MQKRTSNIILALIGVLLVIVSVFIKKTAGNYFLIPLIIGIFFIAGSIYNQYEKPKTEDSSKGLSPAAEYRRKSTILSKPERNMFEILKQLYSDKYEILPQVALNSVIDKITQNSYRNELFRVADFGFFDKDTFAPLILIELNDSSHLRADRADRDKKVNEICFRAGLPIVTFTHSDLNDVPYIKKTINKNILKK